ncbi:MAG: ABC transporter permease [Saprospiraceae bacterium]
MKLDWTLPENTRQFLHDTGEMSRFAARFFAEGLKPRYEVREFLRQCFVIGYKSLPLAGLTAFIMGLVLTMQLHPSMVYYGVESLIPSMVGVAIVREIGPVLTSLIFAGKIGSSIGAELGSMKVTEQIDAMEVSGTNPFKYLVVTRTLAATFMLPILVIISDAISLYGSYLGNNIYEKTTFYLFFKQIFDSLIFADIVPAVIKTFFFGFAIGIIGCYKGYYTEKGTEGVGWAANSAVVVSSVMVFVLDLIAVQITDLMNLYD